MRQYNLVKVFADKATGKDMDREQYQKMIEMLIDFKNPQGINAVVVTKLDRVGRNVSDLVGFVKKLEVPILILPPRWKVLILQPRREIVFSLCSCIAEYERELIKERTEAGLKKYISNGGKMGKPKIKIDMLEVNRLLKLEIPKTVIARKLKISLPTLYDRINEEKEEALDVQKEQDTKI